MIGIIQSAQKSLDLGFQRFTPIIPSRGYFLRSSNASPISNQRECYIGILLKRKARRFFSIALSVYSGIPIVLFLNHLINLKLPSYTNLEQVGPLRPGSYINLGRARGGFSLIHQLTLQIGYLNGQSAY